MWLIVLPLKSSPNCRESAYRLVLIVSAMRISFGTTILALIKEDCIVIGADSLASSKDGQNETMTKLMVIGNAVIACEGMGKFWDSDGVHYRVDEWMAHIKTNVPPDIDAASLSEIVKRTHPFKEMFKSEKKARGLYGFQCTKGYLGDFVIGSASSDRVELIHIRVAVGTFEFSIAFTDISSLNYIPPVRPFVRYGAGRMGEIDKAFGGKGDGYQEMLVRTNGGFQRLIDGQEVALDELRGIVRCAISLESKAEHKSVGPPFIVATLQPSKSIFVTTYEE